jgi:hypothetical protein
MSGHSLGPWWRDGYKNDVVRSAIVRDATGFEVALTRHWGVKETEANANLIAAAPDMLALLTEVSCVLSGHDSLLQDIQAVISKATGE